MKITPTVLLYAALAAVCISLFTWFWLVLHKFTITNPWVTLPWGLLHTFGNPDLRPIAFKSIAFGFLPIGFALYLIGDWSDDGERIVRGARLVAGKQLAKLTRIKSRRDGKPLQIEMAGVPIPPACEPNHLLLAGSTNTGKSTAGDQVLATALMR